MEALLQVKDMTKTFPGVRALDHVNLDLYPGEVHILAGENGAGKSTLVKCILGVHKPDEGQLVLAGEKVDFPGPQEALRRGIGAVYQELTMVPWLNASENIFFNREPHFPGGILINDKKMKEDARQLMADLACEDIDLECPVKSLGIAQQQMVEIAKAVSMHPRVLIFDEPTSSLSDHEIDALFRLIRLLKSKGIAIVYISHRMQELREIGDRVTVLRDGKQIRTAKMSDLSDRQLVELMVGRNLSQIYLRENLHYGGTVLKVCHLSDRKGFVRDCSLEVRSGEIVGIAGLAGAGRTELARLIYGVDRAAGGQILLHGKEMRGKGPGAMVRSGLCLIPEDRKELGLALRAPISWNILAASLKKIFSGGIIDNKKEEEISGKYVKDLSIATPDVNREVRMLSGGNQQKTVLAKWLCADADVLIFDEPTRGIDIGARVEIYRLMNDMASRGKAILMISSDMAEVIGMSDRVYVMREGRVVGQVDKEHMTEDILGQMMMLEKGDEEDA